MAPHMNAMDVHTLMGQMNATQAILTIDDQEYEYIRISNTEFQLGIKGNILTNFDIS